MSRRITIVELVDRTYCNTSLGGIISERISRTGLNTNPGDVISPSWLARIASEHTGFIRHLTEIVWKNWAYRHTVAGRVVSKLVPRTYWHANSEQVITVSVVGTGLYAGAGGVIGIIVGG